MYITIKIDSKKKCEQHELLAKCVASISKHINSDFSKLEGRKGGFIGVKDKNGKEKILASYSITKGEK